MKTVMALVAMSFMLGTTACSQTTETTRKSAPDQRKGPPSIEKIMEMDANKDGQLSKAEVKGRLSERFVEIDTNKDGFLSKKEIEDAPRPAKGSRGPR